MAIKKCEHLEHFLLDMCILFFCHVRLLAHGITIQGSFYLGRRYLEKGLLKGLVLFPLCVCFWMFLVFISTSVPSVIAGEKGSMTIDTVIFRAMSSQTEWQVNIWFTRNSQVVSKIVSLYCYPL